VSVEEVVERLAVLRRAGVDALDLGQAAEMTGIRRPDLAEWWVKQPVDIDHILGFVAARGLGVDHVLLYE
jgi:hypothetical protein